MNLMSVLAWCWSICLANRIQHEDSEVLDLKANIKNTQIRSQAIFVERKPLKWPRERTC